MELVNIDSSVIKLQKPNTDTYVNVHNNIGDCTICDLKDVDIEDHICQTLITNFQEFSEKMLNIRFIK